MIWNENRLYLRCECCRELSLTWMDVPGFGLIWRGDFRGDWNLLWFRIMAGDLFLLLTGEVLSTCYKKLSKTIFIHMISYLIWPVTICRHYRDKISCRLWWLRYILDHLLARLIDHLRRILIYHLRTQIILKAMSAIARCVCCCCRPDFICCH